MSSPRVTLAGWAWRTPLGAGEEARARLSRGESGVAEAPDLAAYGIPRAARIPGEPGASPHARYLHRVALFGVEAALEIGEGSGGPRFGVFTGLGGLRALWGDLSVAMAGQPEDGAAPWANGLGKVHPYWMLRHLSNNAHALLAIALGARGEGTTAAGPTGGAGAIAAAIRALRAGRLERALVMAADTQLQPEILLEGVVAGRWAQRQDDAGGVAGGPPPAPGSRGPNAPGEAAVAVILERNGPGPAVSVESCIGDTSDVSVDDADVSRAFGDVGAAATLAQLVVLAGRGSGAWEAVSGGAPGLVARVRVEA